MTEAGIDTGGETTTLSLTGFIAQVKEILKRISFHNVMVSAAGIAFYGLLALVPTLIALVSVYALVAEPAEIEQQVADAAGSLDQGTRDLITQQLKDIVGGRGLGALVGRISGLAVGILLALFSASSAVQKLMGAVSLAYETVDTRPGWKVRGLAYLFTAGAIVGIALMAFAISAIPQILDRVELGGTAESLITAFRLPVMALLFGGGLTVLYRYGVDRSPRTPWRNPGAVAAMVLFVFFAVAFSYYSSNVGAMPASYGLLGSIAALMIFLQLTALSVIVGAEVNGAVEVGPVLSGVVPGVSSSSAQQPTGRPQPDTRTGVRAAGDGGADEAETDEGSTPLSFGKALAGLVALFVFGRSVSGGE